jgi:hypothetical protein
LAIVAGGFVALMVVSLYATELTRFFVDRTAAPPMDLPHGVDIRYSDRPVELIGKGTPGGVATAITLGYVIVVPNSFGSLPLSDSRRIIRHARGDPKERHLLVGRQPPEIGDPEGGFARPHRIDWLSLSNSDGHDGPQFTDSHIVHGWNVWQACGRGCCEG